MDDEPLSADEQMAEHFGEILRLLGLNAEDHKELQGTPRRLVELWKERFRGIDPDRQPVINVLPSSGDQEDMVMVRDMPFYSSCAHHFLTFFGTCDIAYIPGEQLIGVGTPARILQYYSARPQIQEQLGEQIATFLTKAIDPRGVMVHIVARHLCMEIRGARVPAHVETTATRGWFSDQEWRSEFFERLMRRPTL